MKQEAMHQNLETFSPVIGLIVIALALCVYMLPTFIAFLREHPNTAPIAVVNVFFGWTLLGYVICLAWAFTATNRNLNIRLEHGQISHQPAPPLLPPRRGDWRQSSLILFAGAIIFAMLCVWAMQRFNIQLPLKK
jgi:uncharacterized membrane protein